jgi:hypothetical protein
LSIALLALFLGGGVVGLVFWNADSGGVQNLQPMQANQSNSPSDKNPSANPPGISTTSAPAQNQQPAVVYQPAPTPIVVQVPNQSSASKTVGLKLYNGNIGGSPVSFNLVWNRDKTISGSFFYQSNPGNVYIVRGTNYVEGSSELRVSHGNDFVGQMTLAKSIEGNTLCWQGNYSQGESVRFCRRR